MKGKSFAKHWRQQSRFIMIRASTLLPAFILAFGLATAGVAMAGQSNSSSATPTHARVNVSNEVCASGSMPDPQDCYPPNREAKRGLVQHGV
jgi:hypothetical protein